MGIFMQNNLFLSRLCGGEAAYANMTVQITFLSRLCGGEAMPLDIHCHS